MSVNNLKALWRKMMMKKRYNISILLLVLLIISSGCIFSKNTASNYNKACKSIQNTYAQDECHIFFATQFMDPDVCLDAPTSRDACLYEIGTNIRNQNACNLIENEYIKEKCTFYVSKVVNTTKEKPSN